MDVSSGQQSVDAKPDLPGLGRVCLHQSVELQADRSPESIALEFLGSTLTHAELDARANRLAHALMGLGVRADARVGLCLERGFDAIAGILGILKAGGAVVPLDPAYPRERLGYMMENAKLTALLTQSSLASDIQAPAGCRTLQVDTHAAEIAAKPATRPNLPLSPEHLLYVIHTSGSTGRPKGVAMPHSPLARLVEWQARTSSLAPLGCRTLQFTTLSFDVAYQEIFLCLCTGGTLVLMTEDMRYDPRALWRHILASRIQRLFLPFVALNQLAESATTESLDHCALREVITAGEQLVISPRIRALFQRLPHCTLHNHYGPSETHVATAFTLQGPAATWERIPPIGRPVDGSQVDLLDASLSPVADGMEGEMFISGACLAHGYLHQPDLTAERFLTLDLPGRPEVRTYRTGDLGRRTPDGNLEFLGRMDHQVKIRGVRIELGEVEFALGGFPGVKECVVQPWGQGEDRQLAAYVVPEDPARVPTSVSLRDALRTQLPDPMVPSLYVFLPSLPLTPSGKVDRRSLPAPRAMNPPAPAAPPKPATPTVTGSLGATLLEIWRSLLGREDIGHDDSFFDLGGHSLLLARLQKAIWEELGIEVAVLDLFRHPTLSSLIAHLERGKDRVAPAELGKGISSQAGPATREEAGSSLTAGTEPIAIIGMAGRFPGARNCDELWRNLCEGRESLRTWTDEELQLSGTPAAVLRDPACVRRRGWIEGEANFDATFFGMTPRDAQLTDPQHRFFLECAWEALEDAGCDPNRFPGWIGVYAGSSLNTYLLRHVLGRKVEVDRFTQGFQAEHYPLLVGNDKDYLATRVAHKLGLRGPAIGIQTACSTSLVAVAQACASLRTGQCDAALAGGVSLSFPQSRAHLHQEGAITSNDGRCRPFDAAATGTVFGSGVGIVVLKRLSDALAAGDRIYAVIRGAAVNNDGSDKMSFSAPSIGGQAEVIRRALVQSGVDAASIGYVEAHGTGTPLGDPIEVAALTQAFSGSTARGEGRCVLGSLKGNVGHLEAAAGVTGLIKAALAIHHGRIPGTLHFESANPRCELSSSPFEVTSRTLDWPASNVPRRAGVSSFGVGGTNAHVVLEEAPAHSRSTPCAQPQLLPVSAHTPEALQSIAARLAQRLQERPDLDLGDVAFTLQSGRRAFPHRACVFASTPTEAAAALQAVSAPGSNPAIAPALPRDVAFLFPGQGAQYPGMGRELHEHEPVFRETIDSCCAHLEAGLGTELRDLLLTPPDPAQDAKPTLRQTRLAQPALYIFELALARLWISRGVVPAALLGHSIGEYVAATLAGVFSWQDALGLVVARGELMQSLPPGAMLSVRADVETLRHDLPRGVEVAAINSKTSCVLSGPVEEVDATGDLLSQRGITCKPLHTSHAFHSAMMDPILERFRTLVSAIQLHPPRIPMVSTHTGDWADASVWTSPSYWCAQLRETVRFSDAASRLVAHGKLALLEVGPGQSLTTLCRQQSVPAGPARVMVPSMPPSGQPGEVKALLVATAALWCAGVPLQWSAVNPSAGARKTSLPTYPFQPTPHWMPEPKPSALENERPMDRRPEAAHNDGRWQSAAAPLVESTIQNQLRLMKAQLESLGLEASGDSDFPPLDV